MISLILCIHCRIIALQRLRMENGLQGNNSIISLNLSGLLPQPWVILKYLLRYFGISQVPSRSYDMLTSKYENLLAKGAKATRAYQPGVVYTAQRPVLVQGFIKQKIRLQDSLLQWSEQDMDKYRLPHPLLGKITVREMMYITAYHNKRHLQILQNHELQSHTWENQLQQLIF